MAVNSISAEGHIGWQNDTSDWYAVNLTAGVAYQFDLIGSAGDGVTTGLTLVDPWLWLRNSAGVSIAFDDSDGLGLNSRIFYTPTISGTYYLDAQESGVDATGTYRLIVNASPSPGALTLGTAQAGSVDFLGDADLLSVSLNAGVAYGFALDGNTLVDPYIEVLNSLGATVDYDDDGGAGLDAYVTYTPTTTGTYYLAARESGNNATGSYSARVWQLPTISIANASVLEGNTGMTSLVFTLALSAASPVDVSVTAETSGTATATYSIDYVPSSETVTFAADQTSATFTVQVHGDSAFEPTEAFHVLLSNPVGAQLSDSDAYGYISDNDNPYSLPADSWIRFQWHLYPTTGINVFPVWNDYTGSGVRVAVFDQGIDPNHPDLDGSLLNSLGRNASNLSAGGSPILSTDNHGTAVAGTIAAARDGSGTIGVAYGADLVSIYSPLTLSGMASSIPNAYSYAVNFDVLNDSWGFANGFVNGTTWAFYDNFLSPSFAPAGAALANLAANGRGGLGTVVVQSAGNSFALGDDTNLHNFQNSQYIITVAATDYSGDVTSYSSPGASVLVAAPGGGGGATDPLSDIIVTDRVGAAGYGSGDYWTEAGTSFSAPIVSGIVALMLEANPVLGYRDVQEILAYSARKTSPSDHDWSYNGASNWNGGGLHYDALSHDLGFGLVDARAAVRLAETWAGDSHTASNRQQVTATHSVGMIISDGGGIGAISSAFDSIAVTQAIDVERVEVTLNVTHSYIGDLSVLLTSPSGTTSFLLWRPQQNPLSAYGTNQNNIHFTFDTVLDWGEHSLGSWGLGIYDNAYGDIGTFDSWTLNLIGKPTSSDDTYIYTDEFVESCVDQIARSTLSDTNGIDTLNAATCSSAVVLNLVAGGVSTIDGRSLTIAFGTEIENAYGGDGNDTVYGNSAANKLAGMRGNDTLDGGIGQDTAIYSGAKSAYTLVKVGTSYTVTDTNTGDGDEGIDTLASIEWLQFTDGLQRLGLTASDHNGDGKSDIVLRNSSGLIWQYQMNGSAITGGGSVAGPGTDWKVVGGGDYNGDGKNDILLRNDTTGLIWQYQMNGSTIAGGGSVSGPGTDWKVVGNGDYNGDGKSDILLRNSAGLLWQYQMNGTAITGSALVAGPGTDWKVVGSGDYNGDGKNDILLRNDTTGLIWQYQMNGTAISGGGSVSGPGTDWKVVGSGDYNGDGKADILLRSDSTGTLWQYQMNGNAIAGGGSVAGPGTDWKVVGSGDYNGDGKSDILLRSDSSGLIWQYQMNGNAIAGGGSVAGPGTDWTTSDPDLYAAPTAVPPAKAANDYNGDGKSDILLQNTTNGLIWQYQLNGTAISGSALVAGPGVDWKVVGSGDYNGDGKSDALLQHSGTGLIWQYQLNGSTLAGGGSVAGPGVDWKVAGSGDYNGDGKSDVLLQNATTGMIWQYQLNGTAITGSGLVVGPGVDWKVVGNGDYNGDGKSDVLLRSDSTGTLWQYQMNGTTIAGNGGVGNPGLDWKVVGDGDYNGDGKSDILLRSDSTGTLWQYQMNGTTIAANGGVSNPGTAWNVVGDGDYNGDGKADILLHNSSTGMLWEYQMNGTAIAANGGVTSASADWGVVG